MRASRSASLVTWDSSLLVPAEWTSIATSGPVYAFNPAITIHRGRRLCVYRLVFAESRRRMALVQLTSDWLPMPETVVPLSDLILGAPAWHADPRFCLDGDRVWVHFNSGGEAPNTLSIVELAPDTLRPLGAAVPLLTRGRRQPVEKNWLLFVDAGRMRAVYRMAPHQVLECVQGDHAWMVTAGSEVSWNATAPTRVFGALRGGTPPVRVGDVYVSFFHGRRRSGTWARLQAMAQGRPEARWEYTLGAYCFDARPPYAPRAISADPLLTASSRRHLPALNRWANGVVYACGAVCVDGTWAVSFGENDERCRLMTVTHDDLLAGMTPIEVAG